VAAKYAESDHISRLRPGVAWTARRGRHSATIDARVPGLLRGIASTGTLAAAARAAAIPYRTAWAALAEVAGDLGVELVDLAPGRGATLTPAGARLLAAHDAAEEAMAGLEDLVLPVRETAPRARAERPLRVAASHDVALAQLRDRWRVAHGVAVEFHGSAESLDAYRRGSVDLAGFHVERSATRASDPLLARLDPRRDAVISFITREQGLIVPRGNPRRLRALAQVVERGLAIVNRQPGSGTRLLLDRMLARERIAPARVRGYAHEEFTHAAVAATIAAGRADAGLGIAAAAAQFGLGFVPLVVERYGFACRRRALDSPGVRAFRELLASPATRRVIEPLPGYSPDRPGEADAVG
jgi:molybdate transport repressor ModE-like protein